MLDLDFIRENVRFIAGGLAETLLVSILSILLAIVLAVLLVGMERGFPPFSLFTTLYISLIGGTPLYLQIFFVFLALPQLGIIFSGLWAGVLVLGTNYGARISEIFRGDTSFIEKGQQPNWQLMIPTLVAEFIGVIKDSALVAATGFVHDVMWRATRVGRAEFKNLEALIIAAILYWVLTMILSSFQKSQIRRSNSSSLAMKSGAEGWRMFPINMTTMEGSGGFPMGSTTNETTRLLCASAVTAGQSFRASVLNHLRSKHKAITPEVGLDVQLIALVCNFMEKREFGYRIWFAVLAILAIFLFLISPILLFLPIIAVAVLWYYQTYEERFTLAPYFTTDRFDSAEISRKFQTDIDPEIINGIPSDDQNLIIYKEFSPFVGTGIDLGGWVFSINTFKPKTQENETMPVDISELYSVLESNGKKLSLPGLLIKDILFVHGTAIRQDQSILSDPFDRPLQCLDPDIVKRFSTNSDFRIRHYKWFVVHDWGNEMVFSLFLRCSLRGPNLFVEVNRFLLTPLLDNYHQIDSLPPKSWRTLSAMGIASLLAGPLTAVIAILILALDGLEWLTKTLGLDERMIRREIKNNPLYNYGSSNSLRQMMSSLRYSNYFQKLDREMYIRVLDREILDTIVAFLDDHNVDTSDLKSQQTAILNSGILIQGGNIEAQSVAVGAGSQAVTTSKSVDVSKSTKQE